MFRITLGYSSRFLNLFHKFTSKFHSKCLRHGNFESNHFLTFFAVQQRTKAKHFQSFTVRFVSNSSETSYFIQEFSGFGLLFSFHCSVFLLFFVVSCYQRQLLYLTISSCLCQELFWKTFWFFLLVFLRRPVAQHWNPQ